MASCSEVQRQGVTLAPSWQTQVAHLHSATASSCWGFLWSMMTMSGCLFRKQSSTALVSLATVQPNPAFSHALEKLIHWLSFRGNTNKTWAGGEESGCSPRSPQGAQCLQPGATVES